MLRTKNSEQDWERKKWYLIRSLFEDLPALSPIIETQEPTISDIANGPPSPLPDLIIEPIKNHNAHDEPAEFYTALEIEMRRLYRRDFLNVSDSESSIEESAGSQLILKDKTFEIPAIVEPTFENFFKEVTFELSANEEPTIESTFRELEADSENYREALDNTQESLECESNETADTTNSFQDILDKFTAKTKECDKTSPTFTEQSQTANDDISVSRATGIHEDIVTQVEVQGNNKIESYVMFKQKLEANICSWSRRSSAIPDAISNIDTVPGGSSGNQNEDPAKTGDARIESTGSSSSSNLPEPDVMRKRQTKTSLDSVPRRYSSISEISSKFISNRVSMEAELSESSNKIISTDMDAISPYFAQHSINTSTPNRRKSFIFKNVKKIKQPRVRQSPITRRRSNVSKALQTSFSDDEAELRILWNNFFDSEPVVYKPCSCSHHICT